MRACNKKNQKSVRVQRSSARRWCFGQDLKDEQNEPKQRWERSKQKGERVPRPCGGRERDCPKKLKGGTLFSWVPGVVISAKAWHHRDYVSCWFIIDGDDDEHSAFQQNICCLPAMCQTPFRVLNVDLWAGKSPWLPGTFILENRRLDNKQMK